MSPPPGCHRAGGEAHPKACRGASTWLMLEGFSVARTARPWFWEERNGWDVNKDGRRHFLGEPPADAPPPRQIKKKWNPPPSIVTAFHKLMAEPETPEPPPRKSGPVAGLTV